jgi:hypothetical protein
MADHCAATIAVTALSSRPGWLRATTPRGTFELQYPLTPEAGGPDYTIVSSGQVWDVDGQPGTVSDTLVVPIGARVRWHRDAGLHTITDGVGADDPNAGTHFDYLLDAVHPDFDTTFTTPGTVNFFCSFHEPLMRGVLIVTGNASVPPAELPTALSFMRSPWPNPTRGGVTFSLGSAKDTHVTIGSWIWRVVAWRNVTDHSGRANTVPSGTAPLRTACASLQARTSCAPPTASGSLAAGSRCSTRRDYAERGP